MAESLFGGGGEGTTWDFCPGINTHLRVFIACLCSGDGRLSHQLEISAGQSRGGMSGMQIRSLVHRSEGAGGWRLGEGGKRGGEGKG